MRRLGPLAQEFKKKSPLALRQLRDAAVPGQVLWENLQAELSSFLPSSAALVEIKIEIGSASSSPSGLVSDLGRDPVHGCGFSPLRWYRFH